MVNNYQWGDKLKNNIFITCLYCKECTTISKQQNVHSKNVNNLLFIDWSQYEQKLVGVKIGENVWHQQISQLNASKLGQENCNLRLEKVGKWLRMYFIGCWVSLYSIY